MPFPFPAGPTKGYLMERARLAERTRRAVSVREGGGGGSVRALSRRRRSAIINSARSFLSIVIGRLALDGRILVIIYRFHWSLSLALSFPPTLFVFPGARDIERSRES